VTIRVHPIVETKSVMNTMVPCQYKIGYVIARLYLMHRIHILTQVERRTRRLAASEELNVETNRIVECLCVFNYLGQVT
jgi:hypothetical protein